MEIERKWLIDTRRIPYDLHKLEAHALVQGYLAFSPTVRVRSIDDAEFILTVKSAPLTKDRIAREETEFSLPAETGRALLRKCEGVLVEKTRYKNRRPDGLVEEIDVFRGELAGLAYLEIEFPSLGAAEAFPSPVWVTREVTQDKSFTNASLARKGMPPLSLIR